jgi:hypothetical protein
VAWNNLVHRSIKIKEAIEKFARATHANSGKKWIIEVESIYSSEDIAP